MTERTNRDDMSLLVDHLKHESDNTGLIEKHKIKPIIEELRKQLAQYNTEFDDDSLDLFIEFDKPEPRYVVSKEFLRAAQNHLKLMNDLHLRNAFNCLDKHHSGLVERSVFKQALGYDNTSNYGSEYMAQDEDLWNQILSELENYNDHGFLNFQDFCYAVGRFAAAASAMVSMASQEFPSYEEYSTVEEHYSMFSNDLKP